MTRKKITNMDDDMHTDPTQQGARLALALRLLLRQDPAEMLQGLIRCVRRIYDLIMLGQARGIYEVLEHRTTLELLDARGEVALVDRRETVRFLQDHVEAISDQAWGDGEIFAEYRCSPGVPVDFYQDGSRHTVLISLREVKKRGDVITFQIHRKIVGGFTTPHECSETDIYQDTASLSVVVIFPRDRRCWGVTVTQRSTSVTVALGPEQFQYLEDGRQTLTWEITHPRLHDRYSLKWHW